ALFISSCNAEEKARAKIEDHIGAIAASIENAERPIKDKEITPKVNMDLRILNPLFG
ncbi:MAG: hypothetical protein JKY17_04490, partial [Magnetovibrio sp.]|nr:hypothetical protein [Magnetovibrio sp.]